MTVASDIMAALQTALAAAIPGLTEVRTDPKRQNSARPAALVEHVRTAQRDVSRKTVKVTSDWDVTVYPELDAYRDCEQADVLAIQEAALGCFRPGYLTVGGRALPVKASSGGQDGDRAYIDVQFEFFDDRSSEENTIPAMAAVTTNLKEG